MALTSSIHLSFSFSSCRSYSFRLGAHSCICDVRARFWHVIIIVGSSFGLWCLFGISSFSFSMVLFVIVIIWLVAVIDDESWFINVQRGRGRRVVEVGGGLRTGTVCAFHGWDGGVEDISAILKSVINLLLILLIDEVLNLLLTWWLAVSTCCSFHQHVHVSSLSFLLHLFVLCQKFLL